MAESKKRNTKKTTTAQNAETKTSGGRKVTESIAQFKADSLHYDYVFTDADGQRRRITTDRDSAGKTRGGIVCTYVDSTSSMFDDFISRAESYESRLKEESKIPTTDRTKVAENPDIYRYDSGEDAPSNLPPIDREDTIEATTITSENKGRPTTIKTQADDNRVVPLAPRREREPEPELDDPERPIEALPRIKDENIKPINANTVPKAPELSPEVDIKESEIQPDEPDPIPESDVVVPTIAPKRPKLDENIDIPESEVQVDEPEPVQDTKVEAPSPMPYQPPKSPDLSDEVSIGETEVEVPEQDFSSLDSSVPRVKEMPKDLGVGSSPSASAETASAPRNPLAPKMNTSPITTLPDVEDYDDEIEEEEEYDPNWILSPKNQPSPNQGKTIESPIETPSLSPDASGIQSPRDITAPIRPTLSPDINVEESEVEIEEEPIAPTEVKGAPVLSPTTPLAYTNPNALAYSGVQAEEDYDPDKIVGITTYGGRRQIVRHLDGREEENWPGQTGKRVIWDERGYRFIYVDEKGNKINTHMATQQTDYGTRNDGTRKGKGWLGEIRLPNGDVATEYSIGVELDGQETEIPTLVPTLTEEEVAMMRDDIIPNHKPVPEGIQQKAVEHARSRMSQGLSVWADETPTPTPTPTTPTTSTATPEASTTPAGSGVVPSSEDPTATNMQAETPEDELIRKAEEANRVSLGSFDDYVKGLGDEYDREKAEMAAQEKANNKSTLFTGLAEIGAGVINMLSVGEGHATHQQYHAYSQDWMQKADQDIREHRKRRADMADTLARLKYQRDQLAAGQIRDLAELKYKAEGQKEARARQKEADAINWINLERNGIVRDKNGNISYDPSKDEQAIRQKRADALNEKKLNLAGLYWNERTSKYDYYPDKDQTRTTDTPVKGDRYTVEINGVPTTLIMSKESHDAAIRNSKAEFLEDVMAIAGFKGSVEDFKKAVKEKKTSEPYTKVNRKGKEEKKTRQVDNPYYAYSEIVDALVNGGEGADALIHNFYANNRSKMNRVNTYLATAANGGVVRGIGSGSSASVGDDIYGDIMK